MTKNVYSVFDKKLNSFDVPILFDNDVMLYRFFEKLLVSDDSSYMVNHPEDFAIYYLGLYDYENGCFTQDEPKRIVFEMTNFKLK